MKLLRPLCVEMPFSMYQVHVMLAGGFLSGETGTL